MGGSEPAERIGRKGGAPHEVREARPAEGRGVGMGGGGQDRAEDDEVEGEAHGLCDLCGVVARGGDEPVASHWSRSNDRAGDRGGARAGKPRWVRILAITGDLRWAARIVKVPPHCGHCSMSISNTRLSNRAQPRRAGAEGARQREQDGQEARFLGGTG
jgi:hypothetical protein